MLFPFQRPWFLDVNGLARHTPALHTPFRLFAEYGVVVFALLLLLSWWLARPTVGERHGRAMAAALWAPVAALVALGLNQPLGNALAEPRPYAVVPHALVLVARTHDFSFPSDHAVMAGAVAAGIWLTNRRLGVVAALLALLMAFTRVYVGAHFPLDVVAGLLVGAVVAVVGWWLVRVPLSRLVLAVAGTPLWPLLSTRRGPAHGVAAR